MKKEVIFALGLQFLIVHCGGKIFYEVGNYLLMRNAVLIIVFTPYST